MDMKNSSARCPAAVEDPNANFKILNFSVMMVITLGGIIGNILTILTFQRQKRKNSTTFFLQMLAVFDTLLSITTNLFSHRYAYPLIFPEGAVDYYTAAKVTIATLPFSYICQSISTWTVVAVALDRYIHVCHSLKASSWCKMRIARKVVTIIIVVSLLYNVPRFFEYYKIFQLTDTAVNGCNGYFLIPEDTLGGNPIYAYTYAFGLYLVLMYILPLGLLIFFNTSLIRKVRSMKVPGANGKVERLKGSDKFIPSLIAVVSIFLICQIPDMVLQILWRMNSPSAPAFSIIAYDFVVINPSVNFIIYVIAAKGFRRSLLTHVLTSCSSKAKADGDANIRSTLSESKSDYTQSTTTLSKMSTAYNGKPYVNIRSNASFENRMKYIDSKEVIDLSDVDMVVVESDAVDTSMVENGRVESREWLGSGLYSIELQK